MCGAVGLVHSKSPDVELVDVDDVGERGDQLAAETTYVDVVGDGLQQDQARLLHWRISD